MADAVRRRRLAALAIAGVLLLAFLGWAASFSPVFRARHIRVTGNTWVREDRITQLAGVDTSTNVFHVDTEGVVAGLLSDPWIAAASVQRDLPDTLVLAVQERQPVGIVEAMSETPILASDATVLPGGPGHLDGLPRVHAGLGTPDPEQLAAAAAQLAAFDPVVSSRVKEITVGQDGVITATLSSGTTVSLGVAGEEEAKAEALRAVLRWAATKEASLASVDVSAPDAPGATLADGSVFQP